MNKNDQLIASTDTLTIGACMTRPNRPNLKVRCLSNGFLFSMNIWQIESPDIMIVDAVRPMIVKLEQF